MLKSKRLNEFNLCGIIFIPDWQKRKPPCSGGSLLNRIKKLGVL